MIEVNKEIPAKEKSQLHQIALMKGLWTGSTRFFGKGVDFDYVLRKHLASKYLEYFTILEEEGYNDLHTCKFEMSGKIINIILEDDDEFRRWEVATFKFLEYIHLNPSKIARLMAEKKARVRLFRSYRYPENGE